MRTWIALIVALSFFAVAPTVQAGPIARVLTAPLRLGVATVKGANQVRVNRMEARACRGNCLAAARLENTQARMKSRACR